MPDSIRIRRLVLLAAAAAGIGGCVTSPAAQARQAQQMNDLADQFNDLRVENATLAGALDSLRTVLAKHDSTIARLANATGVTVVK